MATTGTTYDPTKSATQLATAYTAGRQALLTAQSKTTNARGAALTTLDSALSAFESSLAALSAKQSVLANSVTFSSAVGTATAGASAAAGTYSFYVEQLATAGQVSYGGMTDTAAAGSGSLNVMLGDGSNFNVNLANADNDFNGVLTAQEIAAAINVAADNDSRVTASTLTLQGEPTLVLTSASTGTGTASTLDTTFTLDTSGVTNADLKAKLDDPAKRTVLSPGQNAVVWFGDNLSGISMEQTSNTYTMLDDVSITFTKAQAAAEAPVSITVARDSAATQANVQSFVDAYNTVTGVLADLTASGDASSGEAAGPFAQDAGLISLRNRLNVLLRQTAGDRRLANYGIVAQRDGTLALDGGDLTEGLAADPLSLDTLFGSTVGATGVLGGMDKLMGHWTNEWNGPVRGGIAQRKESVDKLQLSMLDRQAALDQQYNNAYKRYFAQFSQLQALQSQMEQSTSLFDNMFSSDS